MGPPWDPPPGRVPPPLFPEGWRGIVLGPTRGTSDSNTLDRPEKVGGSERTKKLRLILTAVMVGNQRPGTSNKYCPQSRVHVKQVHKFKYAP